MENEDIKALFKISAITVFMILLFVSVVYFLIWIMQDPFNLIKDIKPYENKVWEEQKNICINQGGMPIQSGWNGQIKECRKQ